MIQLQFINKLLSSRDTSVLLINNIDDTFFSDFTEEYRYIKNHIENYGSTPDPLTFGSKFPNFDFIEVKEGNDYLVDELYKDKNSRTLARIFNNVRDLINDGKVDEATKLYSHAAEQLTFANHIQAVDIIRDKTRYDRYIERTQDFNKYYISTGFPEFDAIIGGWDALEENATIIARPGIGKSWVLLKTAIAAAQQGLRVGLYSGEMTELKVGYRADTLIGNISNKDIMRGNISVMNEYKLHIDNLADKVKGSIFVMTPSMIKHTATITDLRAFIETYKLDILCVDQHSLLDDERHARDAVTKAANVSTDLKKLQVMKQIPIIAVSQQNRSAVEENGIIDVSHIAQSDKIGQDSTVVVALEQKDNVLTMHIAKARDATAGSKLKYAIDLNKGIFSFIPNEDDALNGKGCDELRDEYEYHEDYGDNTF